MKSFTKILTILIITTLFVVSAAAAGTQKEEVVYVNLHTDGSVDRVYVVNIFEMQTAGRITDHGPYYSVRNMVTTDPVIVNGDEIIIDTEPGKLYYEGDLGAASIPWNVKITYFMDGLSYSPEEIAGKTGDLEMHIVITKNPSDRLNFYENYALMMTAAFDGNKCCNISAPGATIANVGSNKQLSYTILPNKGADVVIESSVVDFEMDAISLNGIRLSLDIDVDTTEMEKDLVKLSDGVVKLDDGAWELRDGVDNLSQGVGNASAGGYKVQHGAINVAAGTSALSSGLTSLAGQNTVLIGGADQIFTGMLASANAQLNGTGIPTLTKGNYAAVLTGAINSSGDTTGNLTKLLTQLTGYETFYLGLMAYTTGVSYASVNASLLSNGAINLSNGASSLSFGLYELNSGTNKLKEAMVNLTDGTTELRDNTTGLDTKFTDKINEVLDPLRGGTENTHSFVSAKNTEVNLVQFVMHTQDIEKPKQERVVEESKEDLNFIQRVLRLFGLS